MMDKIKAGDKWQLKSTPSMVATVTFVSDDYVIFRGYWLKRGESGKTMDSFLAHYNPVMVKK